MVPDTNTDAPRPPNRVEQDTRHTYETEYNAHPIRVIVRPTRLSETIVIAAYAYPQGHMDDGVPRDPIERFTDTVSRDADTETVQNAVRDVYERACEYIDRVGADDPQFFDKLP
jgi:hypothetical protein